MLWKSHILIHFCASALLLRAWKIFPSFSPIPQNTLVSLKLRPQFWLRGLSSEITEQAPGLSHSLSHCVINGFFSSFFPRVPCLPICSPNCVQSKLYKVISFVPTPDKNPSIISPSLQEKVQSLPRVERSFVMWPLWPLTSSLVAPALVFSILQYWIIWTFPYWPLISHFPVPWTLCFLLPRMFFPATGLTAHYPSFHSSDFPFSQSPGGGQLSPKPLLLQVQGDIPVS